MRTTDDLRAELRARARASEDWDLPPVVTGPTRRPARGSGRARGVAVVLALAAAVAAVVTVPALVADHEAAPPVAVPTASPTPTPLGDLTFGVLPPSAWSPAGPSEPAYTCLAGRSACLVPSRIRVDGRVVELGEQFTTDPRGGPDGPPDARIGDSGDVPAVRWALVSAVRAPQGSRLVLRVRGQAPVVLPTSLDGPTLVRIPSDATCATCKVGWKLRVREAGRWTPREQLVVSVYLVPGS